MRVNKKTETKFDYILANLKNKNMENKKLTAKEILKTVEDDLCFSSSHEVATILGRNSKDPRIEVIKGSPYKYKIIH